MGLRKAALLASIAAAIVLPVAWGLADEKENRQPTSRSHGAVELELAEARCEWARQQLARFRSQERAPYLTVVYEEGVKNFERELADLKAGNKRASFDRLLTELKHLTQIAAHRLDKAEATNAKAPGVVEEWEIGLLRAKHDILRLGAAHGELLRSASREEKTDWQLEQLRSIQLLLADQLFEQGM